MNMCPSSVFQTEYYWRIFFYDIGASASPGNMSIRVHVFVIGYFISSMAQNKWQRLYSKNY